MKLLNKEIETPLEVKLNKNIKGDNVSGIMSYGAENDYPQVRENLILNSQTASLCVDTYTRFIGGDGFENEEIGKVVVGMDSKGKPITLDKIRRQIAKDVATFNGFYIHTNLSIGGEVKNTKPVPFKNCRFSKEDDNGYCSKIAVSSDWINKKTKKDIKWYNTFNVTTEVLESNIKTAGGVAGFKGQIYFSFLDERYLYPLSPFEAQVFDMDTEYQVAMFKNSEVRNGFSDKVMIAMDLSDDETEQEEAKNKIQNWLGPNGEKALVFNAEFDEFGNIKEKAFKIEKISTNINDKLFESSYEKSLSNNIRKAIKIPQVLIDYDQGGLSSTSGETIIQATEYYNKHTKDARTFVAECIKEIYSKHENSILKNNENWNLKPVEVLPKSTNV